MATTYKTNFGNETWPAPNPAGSEVQSMRFEFDLSAALALNDLIVMGVLPAGCMPVDWALDTDDLDSNASPTITLDVGIFKSDLSDLSTATADGGALWGSALTTAQAGGFVRNTGTASTRVTPESDTDRFVGVKVHAAPATGATTGVIGLTLQYRAGYQGF